MLVQHLRRDHSLVRHHTFGGVPVEVSLLIHVEVILVQLGNRELVTGELRNGLEGATGLVLL